VVAAIEHHFREASDNMARRWPDQATDAEDDSATVEPAGSAGGPS